MLVQLLASWLLPMLCAQFGWSLRCILLRMENLVRVSSVGLTHPCLVWRTAPGEPAHVTSPLHQEVVTPSVDFECLQQLPAPWGYVTHFNVLANSVRLAHSLARFVFFATTLLHGSDSRKVIRPSKFNTRRVLLFGEAASCRNLLPPLFLVW